MADWKLHTPTGMNDIMPEECMRKREVENTLWTVFASFGYQEVEMPMFEYYDVYADAVGKVSKGLEQESMFKFFDDRGRILALRPEMTTSIARMAATKTEGVPLPLRFCYTGSVFRVERTYGARQREFTQSGIELIGVNTPQADAEIIAAAIEALLAVGMREFHMEIGQVAFFNGLTEQAGLDAYAVESLRERIDSKDKFGIKELTEKLDIDRNIKELMIELPFLFGGDEIFDRADVEGLNQTSKDALENVRKIYTLLCGYGLEKFVSIDLGMLQSIDYYTGSIFKCYTHGIGFPICAGGRYDNLMQKFGRNMGAVGIAFGINHILTVLRGTSVLTDEDNISRTLVFTEKGAEALSYDLAYSLRVNGCAAEGYVGDGDFRAAENYAVKSGAECMIRIFQDGKMLIKDFKKAEIIETTIQDFLEYYDDSLEQEECGCGHDHNGRDGGECGCDHDDGGYCNSGLNHNGGAHCGDGHNHDSDACCGNGCDHNNSAQHDSEQSHAGGHRH